MTTVPPSADLPVDYGNERITAHVESYGTWRRIAAEQGVVRAASGTWPVDVNLRGEIVVWSPVDRKVVPVVTADGSPLICECPRCASKRRDAYVLRMREQERQAEANRVTAEAVPKAAPKAEPKVLAPNPDDYARELLAQERTLASEYLDRLDGQFPAYHVPVSTTGLVKWYGHWVDARRDWVLTGDTDALDRMRAYVTMDYPLLASDVPKVPEPEAEAKQDAPGRVAVLARAVTCSRAVLARIVAIAYVVAAVAGLSFAAYMLVRSLVMLLH